MIAQSTITAIKNLAIEGVVNEYVKVTRGTAKCPFHNEDTASMKVTNRKGIFKCFGCGIAGDAITFVMKHEKLKYYEAIEKIAADNNIAVEYEADTKTPEERKFEKDKLDTAKALLDYAHSFYKQALHNNPSIKALLAERGYTDADIMHDELGFAPDNWKNITSYIIQQGGYEVALEIGLIATKEGSTNHYDVYRNRIIIPIHDKNGQLIGFAGRAIDAEDKAKYINPKESFIYNKAQVLYGLHKAIKTIDAESNCYLVEGYFDCNSLRKAKVYNVVASCGTAFMDSHLKIIKQYTNRITLFPDGDKPGMKTLFPNGDKPGLIAQCVKLGFTTQLATVANKDPDDIVREQLLNTN